MTCAVLFFLSEKRISIDRYAAIKFLKNSFIISAILFLPICSIGQPFCEARRNLQPEDSIKSNLKLLYKKDSDKIIGLFSRLNLNYPGLEKTKELVFQKKWVEACHALLLYYRNKEKKHAEWFENKYNKQDTTAINIANNVLKNIFTFQEITAEQDTLKNGRLNWYYLGPQNDKEWGYFLNRQGYFNDLLVAYEVTGNPVYVRKFNDLVSNWILTNTMPSKKVSTVTWRELEVGLRLISNHWPKVFYGFQSANGFSDVARILMLSSIPEQADYIMTYHRMHSNWAAMELNGLASAAFYWPEFKNASKWRQHAINKIEEEMKFEVYPDGVQNELTSHYHEVALNNFEAFADLAERGRWELPETFHTTIEKMYNYLAYTIRPNGYGLLNNDSNLDFDRDKVLRASKKYKRKDWAYIVTNGKRGERPQGNLSVFFPWAGQMIMRSSWSKNAGWSFFDVGPWGNGHQHNDKLHLSVSAFGHDWLVDGGRYYYKRDDWRKYFISSASHNVILIGGKGQRPYKKLADKPITKDFSTQKGMDFCMGSYTNEFGSDWWDKETDPKVIPAKHTRAVIYLHNKYWVVIDHIHSKKGQTIAPLWHFAPQCRVSFKNNSVIARDANRATFQLIPSKPQLWETALIKGQERPFIQGWYSKTYNVKVANFCAKYKMKMEDTSATIGWVIYPSTKGIQDIKIEELDAPPGVYRMSVSIQDRPPVEITMNFSGKRNIPVSSDLFLEGRCAVLQKGHRPMAACGIIKNNRGKTVAIDKTVSQNKTK